MTTIEALMLALPQVLSPSYWAFMILGSIFGLVMGVLPGLGGIISLALILPFVYGMNAAQAIGVMLGALCAVTVGGAITAILINVPGTSENVATCWDGYPMSQKGEGSKAVQIACWGTLLGGVFGTVALILSVPLMKPLVLAFGPPEYFMLSFMGICIIALLTGKNKLKGFISGGMGLLLAFVGAEAVSGDIRFAFGSLYFYDGIEFTAFIIGVFALSEMMALYYKGGVIASEGEDGSGYRNSGLWSTFKETCKYKACIIRSSIIGVIIGIIPGVGGAVANVVSYGFAAKTSKTPELFGKGCIEGLIAPQAADNAKDGGAIIPTIAFGIPGSSPMAIMLSAFLILGIQPGQQMFTTKLDVTMVMIISLLFSNILAVGFGLLMGRWMGRIAYLRASILIPCILAISVMGAYAIRFNIRDVMMVFVFGFVGYLMNKYEYSRPTMIIGLVLGDIAENYYHLAWQIHGPRMFIQPWTIGIIVVGSIVMFYPYIIKMMQKNPAKGV